ncbi:MAG TPA: murein transglycosylase A [Novimethylophilus sp.]|jgi:membrane-bound lytic murein transglycosylase A|uniref:murein transglycosylase A n=1 Tax=Novimethylophilus sp. TaxID=2137426 RepID=UPI002F427377
MMKRSIWLLTLALAACATQPAAPPVQTPPAIPPAACACPLAEEASPIQIPDVERFVPPAEPGAIEPAQTREYRLLRPVEWAKVEGLESDNPAAAWKAWLQSCQALRKQDPWKAACEAAAQMPAPGADEVRVYLMQYFSPYQVTNPDGSNTGLITGYYEPLLRGSRQKTERYRYPVYSRPSDLITVDLGSVYPELASRRLRGKLEQNRLSPYFSRGEIEVANSPLAGNELLWVDDIIDLFFLQIQGSGLVQLDHGQQVHVGYADQNGQPYQSIGKILINRGELTADKASMQGIKNWARANIGKVRDLLNSNPSYVFFRELPAGLPGPLGALGVPILAERSLAVDSRYIPLGAPVFLSTTQPNSARPLQRLMLAQDTGGAIKGAVRADFFWGAGVEAGRQAGAMKQQGRMWVLLPKGYAFAASGKQ